MRLLLLFFLASAVSCRMNACGSDVSKYSNYLNTKVNVPLDQVADMVITARSSIPRQFKDLMDKEVYQTYYATGQKTLKDGSMGEWTKISDNIRTRTNSYQADMDGLPFTATETQTIDDKKQLAESVVKTVVETALGDFITTTVTCIAPGTIYQADVDVILPIMNRGMIGQSSYYAREKLNQIQEAMKSGFAKLHSATGNVLKKMETCHKDYPYEPVFAQNYKNSEKSSFNGSPAYGRRLFQYKKSASSGFGAYLMIALSFLVAGLY